MPATTSAVPSQILVEGSFQKTVELRAVHSAVIRTLMSLEIYNLHIYIYGRKRERERERAYL